MLFKHQEKSEYKQNFKKVPTFGAEGCRIPETLGRRAAIFNFAASGLVYTCVFQLFWPFLKSQMVTRSSCTTADQPRPYYTLRQPGPPTKLSFRRRPTMKRARLVNSVPVRQSSEASLLRILQWYQNAAGMPSKCHIGMPPECHTGT